VGERGAATSAIETQDAALAARIEARHRPRPSSFGLPKATAADIERTWITGRAVMPAFAGLLLSISIMVWPRSRWMR